MRISPIKIVFKKEEDDDIGPKSYCQLIYDFGPIVTILKKQNRFIVESHCPIAEKIAPYKMLFNFYQKDIFYKVTGTYVCYSLNEIENLLNSKKIDGKELTYKNGPWTGKINQMAWSSPI